MPECYEARRERREENSDRDNSHSGRGRRGACVSGAALQLDRALRVREGRNGYEGGRGFRQLLERFEGAVACGLASEALDGGAQGSILLDRLVHRLLRHVQVLTEQPVAAGSDRP